LDAGVENRFSGRRIGKRGSWKLSGVREPLGDLEAHVRAIAERLDQSR
jgi:hypothetical protein